jgi:uncharacterized protein YqgC (DUF456 family)
MIENFVDGQARGQARACQGCSRNDGWRIGRPEPHRRASRSDGPDQRSRLQFVVELFWWSVTLVLMAIGIIGTVLPILPGTTVIFAAAVLHRLVLGPEKALGWLSILVLFALTLASLAIDFVSGWFGTRRFGATRWGSLGAFAGAIVGIFFGLAGLLIGPVVGALAGEIVGGKRLVDAGRAGWGAFLGNLAGMLGKLLIALAMVSWFLLATPAPF